MNARLRWAAGGLLLLASARLAEAACNLIPSAEQTFRGTLGTTDRPFASPGEIVEVRAKPGICGPTPGFTLADDYVVTVVFTPPQGPRNVIIMATDCTGISPCPGVDPIPCATVGATDLAVVQKSVNDFRLQFRFPDTDAHVDLTNDGRTFTGPVTIAVSNATDSVPCGLVAGSCATESGLVACIDDLYTLDGTCRPIVDSLFPHFTALPPPNRYEEVCTTPPSVCTGGSGPSQDVRFTVDSAGNLLVPVDWRGVLVPSAIPVPRLLRASSSVSPFDLASGPIRIPGQEFMGSFTPEGAPLPPIFVPQLDPEAANEATFFGSADAPHTVLRLGRKSPTFHACVGGSEDGRPCTTEAECPPSGTCMPARCLAGPAATQACDEDADCPSSECGTGLFDFSDRLEDDVGPVVVQRAASNGTEGVCQDGPDAGDMCIAPGSCASSAQCVDYRVEAQDPVPLEGLAGTDDVFTFTVREAIAGTSLDGDENQNDQVLTLRNRTTGETIPIGRGSAAGRTINAVQQAPFSFPALATEGNVAAMLEPEGTFNTNLSNLAEGTIRNGDGDVDDVMLHVFRADGGTTVTDVTGSQEIAAEAELLVNGRSLAVSNGQVFFRAPEQGSVAETTRRISQPLGGGDADGFSSFDGAVGATLSADGRFVVFRSVASNLIPGVSGSQVYLYDRDANEDGVFDQAGATAFELISKTTVGAAGTANSGQASISPTGRYVVFTSLAPNLVPGQVSPCLADNGGINPGGTCNGVVLRDRENQTTELVSVDASGAGGPNGLVVYPAVSADGRFVVFQSYATNLDPVTPDTNTCGAYTIPGTCADIYVRDRCVSDDMSVDNCLPHNRRLSLRPGPIQTTQFSTLVQITSDGHYVMFTTRDDIDGNNPSHRDTPYLVDLTSNTISPQLLLPNPLSGPANGQGVDTLGLGVYMSDDARFVTFEATTVLAPGGSGVTSYIRDRLTDTYELVSSAADGTPNDDQMGPFAISGDGRFVVSGGFATNLVADDTNTCRPGDTPGMCPDFFVKDRLTGATKRVSVPAQGGEADNEAQLAGISADGRTIAFVSVASNLVGVGNDNNTFCPPINGSANCSDVFLRTIDWSLPDSKDQTGDHDIDDTVLAALNSAGSTGTPPTPLCPSNAAAATDGKVAFLRPEPAGDTTPAKLPRCPQAGAFVGIDPDLNGDGDADDDVVHLWRGGASHVENLRCAASAVALSSTHVAAVVTEGGTTQVKTLALSAGTPASCNVWTPSNQAAESVTFCGDVVVFLTPESVQDTNLNVGTGDSDKADRVLQIFDPASGVINTGHAAVDFVCNQNQIVFRTHEADEGLGFPGNNDADRLDDVLQVYDLEPGSCRTAGTHPECMINTGDTVRPCLLAACDPRLPYRVFPDSIKFLTFECDEGAGQLISSGCEAPGGSDLNNDTPPDANDLVIRAFNVRTRVTAVIGTVIKGPNDQPFPEQNPLDDGVPDEPDGSTVFIAQGRCLEFSTVCASTATCTNGEFCDPTEGKCARDQGTCTKQADCPGAALCTDRPIVPASPDTDADGIPDHLDNCRTVANAEQEDDDQDAVGNACDAFCTGPTDAKDSVKVKTRKGAGQVTAKLTIALADYDGEPVTVRLDDTDSSPIVAETLATIPPKGTKGNLWQYKVKTDGLQSVQLKSLAPRNPGRFQVKLKSKHWFSAAAANRPEGETTLTVLIGPSCYSQGVKQKSD
jgi:hypothetical protein